MRFRNRQPKQPLHDRGVFACFEESKTSSDATYKQVEDISTNTIKQEKKKKPSHCWLVFIQMINPNRTINSMLHLLARSFYRLF